MFFHKFCFTNNFSSFVSFFLIICILCNLADGFHGIKIYYFYFTHPHLGGNWIKQICFWKSFTSVYLTNACVNWKDWKNKLFLCKENSFYSLGANYLKKKSIPYLFDSSKIKNKQLNWLDIKAKILNWFDIKTIKKTLKYDLTISF